MAITGAPLRFGNGVSVQNPAYRSSLAFHCSAKQKTAKPQAVACGLADLI